MTQQQFYQTDSVHALFNLLDVFRKLLGLKININTSKTEGMWVGSLSNNKSKLFGIKWSGEPIKALGVYYSCDTKLLHEIGQRQKTCKPLVFKRSYRLWESDSYKVFDYS